MATRRTFFKSLSALVGLGLVRDSGATEKEINKLPEQKFVLHMARYGLLRINVVTGLKFKFKVYSDVVVRDDKGSHIENKVTQLDFFDKWLKYIPVDSSPSPWYVLPIDTTSRIEVVFDNGNTFSHTPIAEETKPNTEVKFRDALLFYRG